MKTPIVCVSRASFRSLLTVREGLEVKVACSASHGDWRPFSVSRAARVPEAPFQSRCLCQISFAHAQMVELELVLAKE